MHVIQLLIILKSLLLPMAFVNKKDIFYSTSLIIKIL